MDGERNPYDQSPEGRSQLDGELYDLILRTVESHFGSMEKVEDFASEIVGAMETSIQKAIGKIQAEAEEPSVQTPNIPDVTEDPGDFVGLQEAIQRGMDLSALLGRLEAPAGDIAAEEPDVPPTAREIHQVPEQPPTGISEDESQAAGVESLLPPAPEISFEREFLEPIEEPQFLIEKESPRLEDLERQATSFMRHLELTIDRVQERLADLERRTQHWLEY